MFRFLYSRTQLLPSRHLDDSLSGCEVGPEQRHVVRAAGGDGRLVPLPGLIVGLDAARSPDGDDDAAEHVPEAAEERVEELSMTQVRLVIEICDRHRLEEALPLAAEQEADAPRITVGVAHDEVDDVACDRRVGEGSGGPVAGQIVECHALHLGHVGQSDRWVFHRGLPRGSTR